MRISSTELGDRTKYIGASDIGTIVGLNPYQTAADLWHIKTGRVPELDLSKNPAVQIGNRLETAVLEWAEDDLDSGPINVHPDAITVEGVGFPLQIHLDGQVIRTGEPVEAKVSGILRGLSPDWGEPGTDDIPRIYLAQCQIQIYGTAAERNHVAALLGGKGYARYTVPANEQLQQQLLDKAGEFWRCVETDTPPKDSLVSMEIAKEMQREEGVEIELPDELFADYAEAKRRLKEAQELENTAKRRILTALGEAEMAVSNAGHRVTYKIQHRKESTRVIPAADFRVFRFKEAK